MPRRVYLARARVLSLSLFPARIRRRENVLVSPLPPSPFLSFFPSFTTRPHTQRPGRDVPFRFCLPLCFTRITLSTLRPRKRRRGFLPNSRAPSKGKTEPPPLFDSTPRPITYAYTLGPLWRYRYVFFRYYAKLFSLFVRIYLVGTREEDQQFGADEYSWSRRAKLFNGRSILRMTDSFCSKIPAEIQFWIHTILNYHITVRRDILRKEKRYLPYVRIIIPLCDINNLHTTRPRRSSLFFPIQITRYRYRRPSWSQSRCKQSGVVFATPGPAEETRYRRTSSPRDDKAR